MAEKTPAKPLIESDRVEGTAVYDRDARRIGTIKRLMIEKISGQVVYAAMTLSGAQGGESVHTLPWGKLKYDTSLGCYCTGITEQGAPKYTNEGSWNSNDPNSVRRVDTYYNVPIV